MSDSGKRRFSLFPKTLGECIEPVTKPLMKAQGLSGSRMLTEWPSIVGSELSRRSFPEKLSFPKGKKTEGILTIAVESGFGPAILHMQPMILERLAVYFGYRAIGRLAIRQGLPAAKTQPVKMMKPVKIDPAIASHVEDGELQEALRSLAQTFSGTK